MMEADRLLAERLQSKEREKLTDEEKAKLFMELMEKRKKHFAALRAQEKRNRPPTKAQKRTQISTYLKHMAMGSKVQESNEKKEEGREETAKGSRKKMPGRKRAVKEQQKESSKKLKVEEEKESEEVEEDDEVELKRGYREDLEALWRIVKAKYGDTRPEDEFERVLYGDLRVMFEPDIKSDVWRILQGYKVTTWKLIDSSRVHFKMNIKFRGGLLGLKRLHGFLEVTAAQPRILPTQPTLSLCPVIDTLFPFSSKNEDKVFNTGILASKEEKSPHLLSHRGFKAFQLIFDFSESPMMIYGGNIPILDVPFFSPFLSSLTSSSMGDRVRLKTRIAPDYEDSRARGFVLRSTS
ncbi:hypothetical protein Tco_0932267 [Tanacetum coccineum]